MEKSDLDRLLELYIAASPDERAKIFLSAREKTRQGLEALVLKDPGAYEGMVPQIFDPQTRLYSKTWFENVKLKDAIEKSQRDDVPLSYILFDLDKFHDFNNDYGHLMGDKAIELFTGLLKQSFRTVSRREMNMTTPKELRTGDRRVKTPDFDAIGRLPNGETPGGRVGYGDEFAIVLYNCDEENARKRVEAVLNEVRKIKIPYLDDEIGFTVSTGIAQYQRGMTPKQLIGNADKSLIYSKREGRDRVTVFSQVPADFNFTPPSPLS
ncbi:MAG TPA: diguanylate cyclase [Candidatus Nanoarchaeia archaeon]|nr:diguanylate cyclase [Candidatus Nanoarchaeia archaeon]